MRRFFISKHNISNKNITIIGEEFDHLTRVLRAKIGDEIECFFDNSNVLVCKVMSIDKKQAVAQILSEYKCEANPETSVTVFSAVIKPDNFELIVQKLCELGISVIVPFTSQYTNIRQPLRLDRLEKIIISACKQCERTAILKTETTITFKEMLAKLRHFDQIIFANENEKNNQTQFSKLSVGRKIALIVGSEGGFSPEEALAIKNIGAISISLGRRILKAETAAIVLSALVMAQAGELS